MLPFAIGPLLFGVVSVFSRPSRASCVARFGCGGLGLPVAAFSRTPFAEFASSRESEIAENFSARITRFIRDDPALVAQNFPLLRRELHVPTSILDL